MYDDAFQASCGKYPSSEEGEGGSDNDVPQSRERKVHKKQEGNELVKLQNEEQGAQSRARRASCSFRLP
jgi:hypothetical protein